LAVITRRIGGNHDYKDSTVLYTREFNDANSAEVDTRIVSKAPKTCLSVTKCSLAEKVGKSTMSS
jgi:hypothetical protein